jgi:hypothetical protein
MRSLAASTRLGGRKSGTSMQRLWLSHPCFPATPPQFFFRGSGRQFLEASRCYLPQNFRHFFPQHSRRTSVTIESVRDFLANQAGIATPHVAFKLAPSVLVSLPWFDFLATFATLVGLSSLARLGNEKLTVTVRLASNANSTVAHTPLLPNSPCLGQGREPVCFSIIAAVR